MGGNWRMPTSEEYKELFLNTDVYLVPNDGEEIKGTAQEQSGSVTIEWVSYAEGTSKGVKFYKKGDKQTYMFVPVSGCAGDDYMQNDGNGLLWSSSLDSPLDAYAWQFVFNASESFITSNRRYFGVPVRGVLVQ